MNVQQLNNGMKVAIKYGKWHSTPEKAEIIRLEYARGARHKVKFLTGDKAGQTEEVTSRSIIPWTPEMDEAAENRDFERKKTQLEIDFKRQQTEKAKKQAEEVFGYLALLGCNGEVKQNHYSRHREEEQWALWITNPTKIHDTLKEIVTERMKLQP